MVVDGPVIVDAHVWEQGDVDRVVWVVVGNDDIGHILGRHAVTGEGIEDRGS